MQEALKNAVKKWPGVHLQHWSCAESDLLAIDLHPPKETEEDAKLEIKETLTKTLKQTRDVIGEWIVIVLSLTAVKALCCSKSRAHCAAS